MNDIRYEKRRIGVGLAAGILALAISPSAGLAQCPNPSWNGYCPETSPRPGERRISAQQFKATHNSYNRTQSVDEQIDDYNCWMLELDPWYDNPSNSIKVAHLCPIGPADPTFGSKLDEIQAARIDDKRVTFITLGIKYDCTNDNCQCGVGESCNPWPAGQIKSTVSQAIANKTDVNRIYTVSEFARSSFLNGDDRKWPSYQELVRRGKNFVFIFGGCNETCDTGDPCRSGEGQCSPGTCEDREADDDLLFQKTSSTTPTAGFDDEYVLVIVDAGCDGGSAPPTANPTDRFLWRAYPGGSCVICSEHNGSYWTDAVAAGYTFIATNCVDGQHTVDSIPTIHSPAPFYVNATGSFAHNWGTHAFPRVGSLGLYRATTEASAMVEVSIQPGTYTLTGENGFINNNYKINRPMELRCRDAGSVIIR